MFIAQCDCPNSIGQVIGGGHSACDVHQRNLTNHVHCSMWLLKSHWSGDFPMPERKADICEKMNSGRQRKTGISWIVHKNVMSAGHTDSSFVGLFYVKIYLKEFKWTKLRFWWGWTESGTTESKEKKNRRTKWKQEWRREKGDGCCDCHSHRTGNVLVNKQTLCQGMFI